MKSFNLSWKHDESTNFVCRKIVIDWKTFNLSQNVHDLSTLKISKHLHNWKFQFQSAFKTLKV